MADTRGRADIDKSRTGRGHVTPGHVIPGHVTPGHVTPGHIKIALGTMQFRPDRYIGLRSV